MKPFDILAALLIVVIWGFNFVVIKIGLQGLPPILFTAMRFLFAALPIVFFIKRPNVPWHLLAGYAAFQFAIQFTLLFSGMKLGFSPGLSSLVIQLQAFFTIGLAVLLLGERPHIAQVLGAVIAFSGMALVAWHLEAQSTVFGFSLVVIAALSWGIGNIFTKKIGKVDALALVVWGSLMAAPPLLLASYAIEGPVAIMAALQHINWLSLGAVLFQAYPTTILGFGIWSLLMRRYPAATVAPFTLLVPVVGMVSAAIVLDEPLQWWKIAAGLLVLTGLTLNQFAAWLFAPAAAAK
jgi:O-acetylserine/cysteine efflux transporter